MAEIGDLKVKLSLDNAQFDRSVKSMNTTLKAMGQEIRGLQNKGKEWGSTVDGLKQKQDAYSRLLEGQQTKVKKLGEEYKKAKAEQGEHADKTQKLAEQYNRATAEMTRTETELKAISAELKKAEAELAKSQSGWNKFGEAAQKAGEKLKAVGDKMKSIGQDLSMKVTAPLVGVGAIAAKVGSDFEAGMSKVAATSGATGKDLELLTAKARELGAKTQFSATEASEAFNYLAMAGWKTQQMLDGVPAILDLAAASGTNLGVTADIVSDAITAFGMKASDAGRFADVMASASANANTNVEMLGESFKYAAPVAGALKFSVEDTALALGLMANAGIKASNSGTALRSIMTNMTETSVPVAKEMKKLGLSLTDTEGNMKSFRTIMDELRETYRKMTPDMQANSAAQLFGKEAMAGALAIINASEADYNKLASAIDNSAGSAKHMAKVMNDNLQGRIKEMKSALEEAAITIYQAMQPALEALVAMIQKLADWFNTLSPEMVRTIVIIGGIVAAIGPLLVIGGILVSSLGSIFTAFGTVSSAIAVVTTGATAATPAIGAMASVFTALTGPIGLAVAALGGLTIGTIAFAKNMSESALPSVDRFGKGVSDATKQALDGFFDLSEGASQYVTNMYVTSTKVTDEMANQLTSQFDQMNTQIVDGMKQRNAEQMSDLQKFFMDSSALTAEEEEKIMVNTQKRNDWEIEQQNNMNERVREIIQKAAEEKRELTEKEHEVINNYNQLMKENAVRTFSESELEQKVILERMKENASIISAEQAAEVVKNAVKQKEDVVKEANETYEKRIAQIIKMRDESGVISAEQADKMIAEATKAKDQTVKLAEDQHQKIIEKAKQQADEHVDKVNWETGEILSKWEQFKNKHADIFKSVEETYKKVTDSIKEVTSTAYEYIRKTINEKLGFVVDFVKEQLDKMKKFWDENGQQILNLVKLHFGNIKSDIQMVMGIIKGIFEIVWPIISNIVKVVWNAMKLIISTALDLILGVIQTVLKLIQGDWEGAWESVKETVKSIWNNIESFFKNVSLVQIGKDIINGLVEGIGSMIDAVKEKVESIANSIPEWAKKILGIKSPSRVMKQIGSWTIEGMEIGMADRKEKLNAVMKDLTNNLINITNQYQSENKKITTKANAEIAQIEKRSKEDIDKIYRNAYAKKRKTNQDENIKIQRIQEDATKKILAIEQKASKDSAELLSKTQKDKLDKIKSFIEDKKSTEELTLIDEAYIWEQSLNKFAMYSKERVEAQKAYKAAVDAVNKEITSINAEYSNQIIKINDDLIKSEEALNKAYEDAVSKRENSLKNTKGLFDEFKVELNRTSDELMDNLRSQIVQFEGWQSQIEMLANRAIDEGLLAELREMGPNALPELVALNSMTDEQLTKYSEMYRAKAKWAREVAEKEHIGMKNDTEKQIKGLRDNANKQLDQLQKEWNAKIKSLTKTTSTELSSLQQIGKDAGQGLLNGLASMESPLQAKAKDIANTIKNTIQSALDIHSPSRVMRGFGINVGEGLVLGMDDKIKQVIDAGKRLASAVVQPMDDFGFGRQHGFNSSSIDNSRSYKNGDTHIYVYGNNASPSEIARKHTQSQRQLAMEWGV